MKTVTKIACTAAFAAVLFLASCSTKDDTTATPASTDPRDKFHGNWAVSETSKDYGSSTYSCSITDSSAATYIYVAYLYGFNKKVYSTVSGSTMTIPSQVIQGNNVTGNGTLVNANRINLTYYVQTTLSHYDTVTAVLTK
jgi:hypothetical protein